MILEVERIQTARSCVSLTVQQRARTLYGVGRVDRSSPEATRPTLRYAPALLTGQMGMGEMGERGGRAILPHMAPPAPRPPALDPDGANPIDDVMDRYARGQDAALAELYRLGAPRVRSFLARLCASLSLADDLTQDAFLRVHAARGQFVAGAKAMPWMLAIARNSYRDYLRREQVRREHRSTTALLAISQRLDRPDGNDRALIARQMLDVVQRSLMNLPVRQREAFVLMRFEGLSLAETADVLGATEAAVKLLVHRAYVVIRAALERQDRVDGDAGKASPR
jgi:RNA polymerase sigma-70 factor (ECF subfamily)